MNSVVGKLTTLSKKGKASAASFLFARPPSTISHPTPISDRKAFSRAYASAVDSGRSKATERRSIFAEDNVFSKRTSSIQLGHHVPRISTTVTHPFSGTKDRWDNRPPGSMKRTSRESFRGFSSFKATLVCLGVAGRVDHEVW